MAPTAFEDGPVDAVDAAVAALDGDDSGLGDSLREISGELFTPILTALKGESAGLGSKFNSYNPARPLSWFKMFQLHAECNKRHIVHTLQTEIHRFSSSFWTQELYTRRETMLWF